MEYAPRVVCNHDRKALNKIINDFDSNVCRQCEQGRLEKTTLIEESGQEKTFFACNRFPHCTHIEIVQ